MKQIIIGIILLQTIAMFAMEESVSPGSLVQKKQLSSQSLETIQQFCAEKLKKNSPVSSPTGSRRRCKRKNSSQPLPQGPCIKMLHTYNVGKDSPFHELAHDWTFSLDGNELNTISDYLDEKITEFKRQNITLSLLINILQSTSAIDLSTANPTYPAHDIDNSQNSCQHVSHRYDRIQQLTRHFMQSLSNIKELTDKLQSDPSEDLYKQLQGLHHQVVGNSTVCIPTMLTHLTHDTTQIKDLFSQVCSEEYLPTLLGLASKTFMLLTDEITAIKPKSTLTLPDETKFSILERLRTMRTISKKVCENVGTAIKLCDALATHEHQMNSFKHNKQLIADITHCIIQGIFSAQCMKVSELNRDLHDLPDSSSFLLQAVYRKISKQPNPELNRSLAHQASEYLPKVDECLRHCTIAQNIAQFSTVPLKGHDFILDTLEHVTKFRLVLEQQLPKEAEAS